MNAHLSRPKVLSNRIVSDSTFVLRFERRNLSFVTGQYLSVGLPHDRQQREYSIYSSENDDHLEILVKIVEGGKISRELRKARVGDELVVDGPFGYFTLDPNLVPKGPFLFVSTGTGISPFHSFVRTFPNLDFTLLHGIRTSDESYDYGDYPRERLLSCVSQGTGGDFPGRVTQKLTELTVTPQTHCFLCGNCNMIYDAFDLLKDKGVPSGQIHTEVYF